MSNINHFGKAKLKTIRITIFIPLIILFLCSSCNLKKPYVGLEVNTANWPKYLSGEMITFETDHAVFELTITETNEDGEYLLQGTMDGSGGSLKSIGSLVTNQSRFSLLLSKNNVVVDNVSFFPLGTDYLNKLPFKKTFKTVPFDSITLTYQISVRG
jgi:hypothetical protein